MPAALLRGCSVTGCPYLTEAGRCQACRAKEDSRRGSAASRGYGAAWRAFRRLFLSLLVAAGVAPVCGATLPDGPQTGHSRCKAAGLLAFVSDDGTELHLDHHPPLQDHERTDVAAVCNLQRIQLLCASCHSAKTHTSQEFTRS